MPKKKPDSAAQYDKKEWYAKYIYPSNLMQTCMEYRNWIKYMEKNWDTLYPEYKENYVYNGPRYWKLANCHNVLIHRDINWFNNKVPAWKSFWDNIVSLRNNKEEKDKFLVSTEKKPRKSKSNDFFSPKKDEFLSDTISESPEKLKPKPKPKPKPKSKSVLNVSKTLLLDDENVIM